MRIYGCQVFDYILRTPMVIVLKRLGRNITFTFTPKISEQIVFFQGYSNTL